MKCPLCDKMMDKDYITHPPEYDEKTKTFKVDENGVIWTDKTKPQITIKWCGEHLII